MNMIAAPAYENIGEMVEEIRHLRELLQAGMAACLEVINAPRVPEGERDTAEDILRALGGEVKP